MKKVYKGMQVNYLTVIDDKRFHKDGDYKQGYYLCECKCGNKTYINDHNITTGRIRDCGCGKYLLDQYIGKKYGNFEVINAYRKEHNGHIVIMVDCKCVCGNIKTYRASRVKTFTSQSCGCLYKYKRMNGRRYHYKSVDKRVGAIWGCMISRCYNENDTSYKNYGGRGIKVCNEWRDSALAFYNWAMANGYKDDLTIDRIDVNGNYCPENCRWISMTEQLRNTRRTIQYEFNGKNKTIAEIARELNISQFTLYSRIRGGMDIKEAIEKPIIKRRKNEKA